MTPEPPAPRRLGGEALHPGELNTRGAGPLEERAATLALDDPAPPRTVRFRDLVPLVYPTRALRVAAGVGVVAGLLVVMLAIATWGQAADSPLLLAVGLGLGVVLPLIPLLAAVRVRRVLRRGVLARGEVVEISDQRAPRDTDPAVAEHGRTAGTVDVTADDRRFAVGFETDNAWGLDLDHGATVVGLADPERDRVLLWLGTTSGPRAPRAPDAGDDGAGGPVR